MLRFDRDVSLSVVPALSKLLAVWVGFCHVVLVPTCLVFVIWGGINVPMVLPPDNWNLVTISALGQFVGFWVILKGQQRSFWMVLWTSGSVPRFLPDNFPLGFYLGRVGVLVKRRAVTSGNPVDCLSNFGKRVRLTKKTRPDASSHVIPDPRHSTPRRWKRLRPPSSEGEGGEVGVPRNLFPRLGVG